MGSLEVNVMVVSDDDGDGQNNNVIENNNVDGGNENVDGQNDNFADVGQGNNSAAAGQTDMFNGEDICYALPKTRLQFARVKFIKTSCSQFYDFVAMFLPLLEHHRDFGRKSRVFMMRRRIFDLQEGIEKEERNIGRIREDCLQLHEMELKSVLNEWSSIRNVLEDEYAEIRLMKFPERYPLSVNPQEKHQWLMEYAIPSITDVKRRWEKEDDQRIHDLAEKSLHACRLAVKYIHLSQTSGARDERQYTRMALGSLAALDAFWNRLNQASGQPAASLDGRTHSFQVGSGRGSRLITHQSGQQSRPGMQQDGGDNGRALAGEDVASGDSKEVGSFAEDAQTSEDDESSAAVEEVVPSHNESNTAAEVDLTAEDDLQGSDDGDSTLEVVLPVEEGDTFEAVEVQAGEEDAPITEENVSVVEVILVTSKEGTWAVEEHNHYGGQGDSCVEVDASVLEEKTPGDAKNAEVLQVTDEGTPAAEKGFSTIEGTPAGYEKAELVLVADGGTWLIRAAEHDDVDIEKVAASPKNGPGAVDDGPEKAELHLVTEKCSEGAKQGLQIAENGDHQGEKIDAVSIKNGPVEAAPVPEDDKKAEIVPEDGARAADTVEQSHAKIEEVVSALKNGPPSIEGANDLVAKEGVQIAKNGSAQAEGVVAADKTGPPSFEGAPGLKEGAVRAEKSGASMAGVKRPSQPPEPPVVPTKRSRLDLD